VKRSKVHRCSLNNCDQVAICGLQNKDNPSIIINVCREHFVEMKGREPTLEEIKGEQLLLETKKEV